ncbi:MAG: Crp/Fnr family transcriptional regulator [endosymbiont of Galathealinum brachiosum]|uniref:Crp/Fnr family transcriptional regulator n=1 Tax=endosymbiont of Galathealinum brachiosum TaxID=2200906 RepID=A0A370DMC0_9GAMM|nr:MAG: Crp/Fnr family transcriptional regulator [endosymbiont of Galathealinum brachiosum]
MKTVTLQDAWKGEADCLNCALRNTVLFSGLSETDFEKIHKPIDQFVLPAGSTLYHAHDNASFLYTIRSGVVKLTQYLADGNQRIVRLAFASDVIGLESLIEPQYKHDAVALRDVEVCRLPAPVVNQLSTENQLLHKELLNRWHLALNEADDWITQLSTGSARQRMANLLLKLAEKYGSDECELFTREDIGSMLSITTETASRTIAEFKRKGLIQKQGSLYKLNKEPLFEILSD